jgi:hypothetical protein
LLLSTACADFILFGFLAAMPEFLDSYCTLTPDRVAISTSVAPLRGRGIARQVQIRLLCFPQPRYIPP